MKLHHLFTPFKFLLLAACATVPTVSTHAHEGFYSAWDWVWEWDFHWKKDKGITLRPIGSVAAGEYLMSAAEIVAHDPKKQRLFVVNAQAAQIDVVSISKPTAPKIVAKIDVTPYGAVANSVSVKEGLIAVAVQAEEKTDPGKVVFFDSSLKFVAAVTVGSLPDMLTFTPNGNYVLVANEGEPNADYSIDPEGTVSIIDLRKGVEKLKQKDVKTAHFRDFKKSKLDPSIRIFGPGASVAQDLEPEFITVSEDSKTAWVTLQEGNAIGIIDIDDAKVTKLVGLGTKDHSKKGNGLDASDRDGGKVPSPADPNVLVDSGKINIQNWPVRGLYLPDGIASFRVGGETFLLLANEGDAREYINEFDEPVFIEEARIGSLNLDPTKFPPAVATELKKSINLGRLKATLATGDTDGDGDIDVIHTFGARSFTVRSAKGELIWDSGDQFEKITSVEEAGHFNASNENNNFDDRSDDKGPEPEGVVTGKIDGRTYAFVCLERIGGIMIYDVSNPYDPEFVEYVNNRDFTVNTDLAGAGDLGPEGIIFIAENDSPNGKPLIVIGNEVSGTTTIYEINKKR